jgi:ABC-type lipoprotein release transport system permease subunit
MVVGIAGALILTRFMEGILFGVAPGDPLTLAATAAVLFLVAATASSIPAWRASRVDPARVLNVD